MRVTKVMSVLFFLGIVAGWQTICAAESVHQVNEQAGLERFEDDAQKVDSGALPASMQTWFRPNLTINHALFSPADKIKETIIACINYERKRVSIAVFWLTDIDIARALIEAKRRGVAVEVVTDPSCLADRYNKVDMLVKQGIPVYVYNKTRAQHFMNDKMHEKFALFEYNLFGKRILIEGSFNYTQSANRLNCEHVVVHDDHEIANQFMREFERLKKISTAYRQPDATNDGHAYA